MQNGIRPGAQVRRTLADKSEYKKESFPEFAHYEHFMGGISVQKESLAKQREVPMGKKESYDDHYRKLLKVINV